MEIEDVKKIHVGVKNTGPFILDSLFVLVDVWEWACCSDLNEVPQWIADICVAGPQMVALLEGYRGVTLLREGCFWEWALRIKSLASFQVPLSASCLKIKMWAFLDQGHAHLPGALLSPWWTLTLWHCELQISPSFYQLPWSWFSGTATQK